MINMTTEQRAAVMRLHQRNPDGAKTLYEFMLRVQVGWDCLMIKWCGMWIGIEKDGYTHS